MKFQHFEIGSGHNKPWKYNRAEKEVSSAGIVIGVKGSMFDPLPKISKNVRN